MRCACLRSAFVAIVILSLFCQAREKVESAFSQTQEEQFGQNDLQAASCWRSDFSEKLCCSASPRGNQKCWDGAFTYERCCFRSKPACTFVVKIFAAERDLLPCMGTFTRSRIQNTGRSIYKNMDNAVLYHDRLRGRWTVAHEKCQLRELRLGNSEAWCPVEVLLPGTAASHWEVLHNHGSTSGAISLYIVGEAYLSRTFPGASPISSWGPCLEDSYHPSSVEIAWVANANKWTGTDHCSHMAQRTTTGWIHDNEHGRFDPFLFSRLCRKGKPEQYIEPLAGLLRDPRFDCNSSDASVYSVDWLVFPDVRILNAGAKSRFYDAGGSTFREALNFFLSTYSSHGIVFDEVYVWERQRQGVDSYWRNVPASYRSFWEPRLRFFDGVSVTADIASENNPVTSIFRACAPQDFCVLKLDIDAPDVELPLIHQLLDMPSETQSKLDELYFEHHVHGAMQRFWGDAVSGTFVDSYKMFSDLRGLGVRAHSWV